MYRIYVRQRIEAGRLKVSRLTEVNDPFELMGVELSGQSARQFMRKVKEESGRQIGMICFSETWRSPLMWSHYADRRRGICLEFEVPEGLARQVSYVRERLPYPKESSRRYRPFCSRMGASYPGASL